MKPALETIREYLDAKRIRYGESRPGSIRFTLLVPTPAAAEMPNRLVSCAFTIPPGGRTLQLSAAVMAVELSDELADKVASFLMRYQSGHLRAGKILLHDDGAVFYAQTQFLCNGGTLDGHAVASMVTAAILEMAAIFMIREEFVRILPPLSSTQFGLA